MKKYKNNESFDTNLNFKDNLMVSKKFFSNYDLIYQKILVLYESIIKK